MFPSLRPCLFRESSAFLRLDSLGRDAILLFLIFLIFLISERRGEIEGGKERGIDDGGESFIVWLPSVCPTLGVGLPTWVCALIGELNLDLLVHRSMLNP